MMSRPRVQWARVRMALPYIVGGFCIVAVFSMFGESERGWAAAMLLIPFPFVVNVQWDKRRETWFWATLAILALATLPAIILVPWQALDVASQLLYVMGLTQFTIIWMCVALVDKVVHRKRRPPGDAADSR